MFLLAPFYFSSSSNELFSSHRRYSHLFIYLLSILMSLLALFFISRGLEMIYGTTDIGLNKNPRHH